MRTLFANGFAWPTGGRLILLANCSFMALTAVAGGIGLLIGGIAPDLELLEHSPFQTYAIPGMVLVGVGVTALLATILLAIAHRSGSIAAVVAGLMMVVFELVEVWTIGSPDAVAGALQLFYLSVGAITVIVALASGPPTAFAH